MSRKGQPSGSSAFRSLMASLADEVDRARELGMPIVMPDPGTEHGRKLYATLGVEIDPTKTVEILELHDGDQVVIDVVDQAAVLDVERLPPTVRQWFDEAGARDTPAVRALRKALGRPLLSDL